MKAKEKFARWFLSLFERRLSRLFLGNCYRSIDTLPIFYWNKIHETENYSYLIRTERIHIEKKNPTGLKRRNLKKHWRKLLDEFVERYGLSENTLAVDAKEVEIARMKVDRLVNNNKSLNAFISIAELQLEAIKSQEKSTDFHELKAYVELEWGHLNPMVVTVGEFYSYVKILQDRAKKAGVSGIKN